MPTVHMVCGPLGAGKTSMARRLAAEHRALRFSLDEWVMQLFGTEAPQPMVYDWWLEHCRRCSERIWSVCRDLLARNVDVVLDFGFPGVAHRAEYRRLAAEVGAGVHLHVVAADAGLRWERVQARNRERPETFALIVTEDMFRGSEAWWEPPNDAERAGAITFHAPNGLVRADVAHAPTRALDLRTERLLLRSWRASDREPFAALNSNPRVMEYFPARMSRAQSDELVARIEAHFEHHGFGLWALEIPGGAAFIGFVGLAVPRFEAHFTPCVEIGWRLDEPYWGHGYATEGARAAAVFAFDTLRLQELVSFTVPQNARSRRVMEKLGMTHSPSDDFDHPSLPGGHRLRRHVLYRLGREALPRLQAARGELAPP